MKKRTLCLWLPRWPIQRRVVDQPSLSGRPIVLHARDPRRGECVAVCSTAALRQGVRAGMPLAEAMSLMRNAECGMRNEDGQRRASGRQPDVAAAVPPAMESKNANGEWRIGEEFSRPSRVAPIPHSPRAVCQ